MVVAATCNGGVSDTNMLAKCKRGIEYMECRHNRQIGLHKDGTSHGPMGVTVDAVVELGRRHKITQAEVDAVVADPSLLDDPETNDRYGTQYLLLCVEDAGGSWWNGVGYYHAGQNGSKEHQDEYARDVWAHFEG